MLAYMENFMEAGPHNLTSKLRSLEIILDYDLQILAMRFDHDGTPGRDIKSMGYSFD